jgi:hypothetical protein
MLTCANHAEYISDCLECIKSDNYESQLSKYTEIYGGDNFDTAPFIGKSVRSDKEVAIYGAPGEAVKRTVKPNMSIGVIKGFNTKQNWAQLNDGNWIYFENQTFRYGTPAAPTDKSTTRQIVEGLIGSVSPSAVGSATAAGIAADEKVDKAIELLPDLDTIKWVLIVVAVIIVLVLVYKIVGK